MTLATSEHNCSPTPASPRVWRVSEPETRVERKERTRRSILDAALTLSEGSTLAAVSLRQVAKEVGVVPTAFYRHFANVDELGLALVDESFESLRRMLREVRTGVPEFTDLIDDSLAVLVRDIEANPGHYSFIARERAAGPAPVRARIHHEIDLITRELSTDIARLPGTETWSTDDLRLLADLIVATVVTTAERMIEGRPTSAVVADTRRQLRMLLVGALNWRS